ncbi:SulP family inorganic anion transporter [Spirosoma pollinicola]|uniref:SulP family inorganic anion transporter n=1 Tax=Spirosoma pollinicola TaxID=2057025 RepID=UPI0012FD83C9|nr:SulP family inorganic anion transporter [Spirosoma pollinicola]
MPFTNPFKTLQQYRPDYLSGDLTAGLSVFFASLPLCLGIALASGAPSLAGLIAGIVGGLIVGSLSGSEVSVSKIDLSSTMATSMCCRMTKSQTFCGLAAQIVVCRPNI